MRLLEISQLTVTLVLTGNETELEAAIGIFRTHWNIDDGVFFAKMSVSYFCKKAAS